MRSSLTRNRSHAGAAARRARAARPYIAVLACALLVSVAAAAADSAPRFEPTDCWFTKPQGAVDCGYLVVPENRREADRRTIRVAVAIIKPMVGWHEPDPVVMIGGGPGQPVGLTDDGIEQWRGLIRDTPALQQRDVILFEQRGVGRSLPDLNCPEIDGAAIDTRLLVADNTTMAAAFRDAAIACRDRLVGAGVDLGAYAGVDFADDLADMRQALGIDSWNLVGTSYGTRIVLTMLRDHPEGMRSAVLNSVYPLEVQSYERYWMTAREMLDKVFAACAGDPDCHATYPDPAATMRRLVSRLNEAPLRVEIADPRNGSPLLFPLTGWMVGDFVLDVIAFQDADDVVPYLGAMAEGSDGLSRTTADYMATYYADLDGFSDGVNASAECREEYPFNDHNLIDMNLRASTTFEGTESPDWMRIMCEVWPVRRADPAENQAVTSDIPTLILTGEIDPITPPAWAWAAHEHLHNSYVFEFRGIGHDVLSAADCAPLVLNDFLEDPTHKPATSCLRREVLRSSAD